MSDQFGDAVMEVGAVLLVRCSPSWDHYGETSTEEVAEATGTLKRSSWNWTRKSVGKAMEPKLKDTWVCLNSQLQY